MPRKEKSQAMRRTLGKTGNADSPSYFTTIPIEIIRKLGWYDGREVIVRASRGKVIIEPAEKD